MKNGIERKMSKRMLLLVGGTMALVLLLFVCVMLSIRANVSQSAQQTGEASASSSETLLIEQSLSASASFVEQKAKEIDTKLSGYVDTLRTLASTTARIYERPQEFLPLDLVKTPDEHVASGPEGVNAMQWIPFDAASDTEENKANWQRLGSLYGLIDGVLGQYEEMTLLYIVMEDGYTIGVDKTPAARAGIQYYDASGLDYFTRPLSGADPYISEVYLDSFGKGNMLTISVPITVSGKPEGAFAADILVEDLKSVLLQSASEHIDGAMLFDAQGNMICASESVTDDLIENAKDHLASSEVSETAVGDDTYYLLSAPIATTGWKLMVSVARSRVVAPAEEAKAVIGELTDAMLARIDSIIRIAAIAGVALMLVCIVLVAMAVRRVCREISQPITKLTEQVSAIGDGNLDFKNEIATDDEVQVLGERFEQMTVSLKEYIANLTHVTAEKERIGAELDIATHIQASMLPCIFPAFPDRKEFDIYATMDPAKEVGGDFYDFFMVDDRHLAIVMADVSGKGVPAALFMVIGKTLIKDNTQPERNLGEVFTAVNELLCESNSEGLFITAFEGVLDLVTGEFNFVNAGHEMPFICKAGEGFEAHKIRAGFVLAGMEGMRYRAGSMTLSPGDKLFQYTDGVTEATDADNELYGMDRLHAVLNRVKDGRPDEILPAVRADIDAFVKDAPQFDDITMLCLEYKEAMKEDAQ